MDLFDQVQNIIEETGMLHAGDGVVVGVSGGPDSLCLLHVLMRMAGPMQLKLRAVHLNHGFRGEAADADAAFVTAFCAEHGISCIVYSEQVAQQARERGVSEETAGRDARYRCFFVEKQRLEQQFLDSGRQSAVKIAVAHNSDDQAETILMRIMRGTGIEGLQGMQLQREDGVIRPLLLESRRQIEAYCSSWALAPREDATNQQAAYTRNRVRLELLPYMREHFNDHITEALCRLGRIAQQQQEIVGREIERCRMELVRRWEDTSGSGRNQNSGSSGGGYAAERSKIAALPEGLRHGLSRSVLKAMGLSQNLSSVHLQQIDALLKSRAASGQTHLPKGYRAAVSYDQILWLWPDKPAEEVQALQAEGARARESSTAECATAEGFAGQEIWQTNGAGRVFLTCVSWQQMGSVAALRKLPFYQKCLDGDKIMRAVGMAAEGGACAEPAMLQVLTQKLTLRCRRAGDVIRPLGSSGRKKMQDYFVDRKIPRQQRDSIPLLCIGSEVIWAVGLQISENFKAEERSERLIFVEFHE